MLQRGVGTTAYMSPAGVALSDVEPSEGWRRVADVVRRRRKKHFDLTQTAVEMRSGGQIKTRTLRKVELAEGAFDDSTLWRLERFFRWPEGYLKSVMEGGPELDDHWEPPEQAEVLAAETEIRQTVDALNAKVDGLTDRLSAFEALVTRLLNQADERRRPGPGEENSAG